MTVFLVLVLLSAGFALYQGVTFAPRVDPAEAAAPMTPNWLLAAPAGADTAASAAVEAPVWRATPLEVIAALDAVVLSEPRTERLSEGPGGGGAFGVDDALARTYLQRSETIGYPDYANVRAVPVETGGAPAASVIMLSRSVYGIGDAGVNQARVERWIAALDARFERVE